MKLSEQLREEARQQDELWRKHGDECFSSAESVLLRVSELAEAYEAEPEKRIAELEAETNRLRECMRIAGLECFMRKGSPESVAQHMHEVATSWTKRIAELQSQLAWTPVSAGLPTEPGMYEFLTRDLYNGACIGIYELDEEVGFCVSDTGKPVRRDLTTQRIFAFRRIELPEAK